MEKIDHGTFICEGCGKVKPRERSTEEARREAEFLFDTKIDDPVEICDECFGKFFPFFMLKKLTH